ncbi:hypothetical protein [Algicella marina]|uniref:Lipoprotein n=1 Tax=Algicella marina TaxID=2683284 RepID=A0A6P1SSX5_9RHOB|nr:hypothetical protein [Algicella marina]QHQ33774.1 hypothetical protein GO499_00565 [Algicella marina]
MRLIGAILILLAVAGCAREVDASYEEVARARYVSEEPPYIAIVSMVDRSDERAAHTAMIINASERVIYDPAGTFQHRDLQERGDIHYGATDRMVDYYERYHARFSHYVHTQKIYVTAELAERVLRRTQAQGPSPKMFCTLHTGQILKDQPEFAFLKVGFFPENLRRQFARYPGVVNSYVVEEDAGKVVPEA